jgi:hypothetical protein
LAPLEDDEKKKILLQFGYQNQTFYTTILLTVTFGAFALLELIHGLSGLARGITFVYYIILSVVGGYPVYQWIVNIKFTNKILNDLGFAVLLNSYRKEIRQFTPGASGFIRYKYSEWICWCIVSVLLGILGVTIYLGS